MWRAAPMAAPVWKKEKAGPLRPPEAAVPMGPSCVHAGQKPGQARTALGRAGGTDSSLGFDPLGRQQVPDGLTDTISMLLEACEQRCRRVTPAGKAEHTSWATLRQCLFTLSTAAHDCTVTRPPSVLWSASKTSRSTVSCREPQPPSCPAAAGERLRERTRMVEA